MKRAIFSLLFVSILGINTLCGQTKSPKWKEETLMVLGNCGMCKTTIEKTTLAVKGVKEAVWEQETHLLTVTYRSAKTSPQQIGDHIALSGYDNEYAYTTTEIYEQLHSCCKYDRSQLKQK